MSKKWVTSDHHFGHENIIKHCNRPFINAEDMKEQMISRWNSVVRPNDLVYHLGDLFYHAKLKDAEDILDRLNGQIFFIEGNHDIRKVMSKLKHRFAGYESIHKITVAEHTVVLCHYAMRVWQNSVHGSWHLYGHSHGQLPEDPLSLSFDVGVDAGWDYTPVSEDQIVDKMNKKIEAMAGRCRDHGDNRFAAAARLGLQQGFEHYQESLKTQTRDRTR
jgi:calcineurin-like phosphoesterase family protein